MLMVQDRAPVHTSQVAKAAQKHLDIHTLAHPPNSPDLNPIELLWNLLKTCMVHKKDLKNPLMHIGRWPNWCGWACQRRKWAGSWGAHRKE